MNAASSPDDASGSGEEFDDDLPDLYGIDGPLRPLPDDVAALIFQRRIDEAIVAMRAHGFRPIQAYAALTYRYDVPPDEAKRAVHFSPAYQAGRAGREQLWDALERLGGDDQPD